MNHTYDRDFTGHLTSCYFHYFGFFLFAYVCLKALFTFFVALSTCTNNMRLKLILINIYKYDDLKLASSCRNVAPSSKVSYLVYLLSGLPIFTKVPPSLATLVQRTTYQVVCQAEGFPRPVINWNRLGIPLPAGRTEVTQGTGTLIIKKVIPADSGLYECTATNTMGTKRARINVAVQQQKLGMLFCLSKESFW